MQRAHAGSPRAAPPAAHARGPRHGGRIGPNAITRVGEALRLRLGPDAARSLFAEAGIAHHAAHAPCAMVDEAEVARLQAAVRTRLGPAAARDIAREAGRLTGDYLLAHRIPRLVQALLARLPARLAARLLAAAIARNAWTFAGSGNLEVVPGRPFVLRIAGCPLCRAIDAAEPVCDYYAATFERIFGALVHAGARVVETECQAAGARACGFEVDW